MIREHDLIWRDEGAWMITLCGVAFSCGASCAGHVGRVGCPPARTLHLGLAMWWWSRGVEIRYGSLLTAGRMLL